jgi:curved DNA-binding protein
MPVQYKDYYETLGVPRTAKDDEIKKSFRRLAREFHPDVAKDKKRAEEKFKEINEAYEVLSDPAKRKKYDELGANWKSGAEFRPPPGHEGFPGGQGFRGRGQGGEDVEFQFGGTGFSDFFEQFFGSRMRGGGESGDLFLRVRLAKHSEFDVDGHDLIYEAELAPWEAVLGTEISVPALDGRVSIKIHAGTQSGQKLRVRGRGLPQRGGDRGDLFVITKIVVPARITDTEKKLWEQLKRESKFNPRA